MGSTRRTIFIVLMVFLSVLCSHVIADERPCRDGNASIEVNTELRYLYLCNGQAVQLRYKVALGRGGVGKSKQGDLKTPLGNYALGLPQPSKRFYTFIPIEYPTAEQKSQGYSGGDIGIHGPMHRTAWLGALTTLINWTQGCIAVSSKENIREIADWLIKHRPTRIIVH